jgi:hypothetical protein
VIKRELAKCPDNVPRSDLPDLPFIKEAQLRNALRKDLSSAAAALAHDEWKAATVLAGSVTEALLLWALKLRSTDLVAAIASPDTSGAFRTSRKPDATQLDRWDLAQYIIIAGHLNEVGDETAKAADLTREFRNLIHPGRAKRTQQTCTRGTAFGALQRVIDDLAQRHS